MTNEDRTRIYGKAEAFLVVHDPECVIETGDLAEFIIETVYDSAERAALASSGRLLP